MYYAKSNPKETIKQHTNKLLENLTILKDKYGDKIACKINIDKKRFWMLMKIVCLYHDVGKVFTPFQNMIRAKIELQPITTRFNYELIKHEQISPMFVPCKKYNLTEDERKLVYQAIYYHHERDSIHIDRTLLKQIIEEDIKPNLEEIKKELQIEVEELKTFYLGLVEGEARIREGDKLYNEYCLLKGLLHRLDHCSSGYIKVEDETDEEVDKFVEKYMAEKNFNLNNIQTYSRENSDNNLVVIGSTGIGKTEASLMWSKNDKTFFSLPLRISINAIYDRISEKIRYEHVGLLHSTALDYLEGKDDRNNQLFKMEQSRNLYPKIITCTIDQIFTFVFKYKGYEKMYSTLSYSKIIIDEIQAYSPEIVAIILKGLQMINNLGGKFMIMTATLPRIYKEELAKMNIEFKYGEFLKNSKRHKIELLEKEILEDTDEICKKSKNGKVLIIVNTVNKAIELYNKWKSLKLTNINLLHSRFILNDRNEKEEKIKDFSRNDYEKGIWITTQIVEASLDIDFDYLYTEMSTLDSLFQRLGRCYRSREYTEQAPNVKIYIKNMSGIKSVYDEEINKKSIELLKKYNNEVLTEKEKVELVDKLYSKEMLEGTDFYNKFKDGIKTLNNIEDYEVSKKEAQKLLRNIDNVYVIPKCIYDENLKLFEIYEETKNNKTKIETRRKINKLILSVSKNNLKKLKDCVIECPYMDDVKIIDIKYNKEIGLLLEKDEEYEYAKREL